MQAGLIDRWKEALLLPGEVDPVHSGLRELSEYFDITIEEARIKCETALADSKREWESSPRNSPEQIADFYRYTHSYIFEHIWWHAIDVEANSANVAILDFAMNRCKGDYLDFGSGVGSNAILFARLGLNVTLADISTTMLEFARWRMERRGLQAKFIDLNLGKLPDDEFDFATAVDVFEHVHNPGSVLMDLSRSIRKGGLLVFNFRAGRDDERPMHILRSGAPVLSRIRSSGLRLVKPGPFGHLNYYLVERCSKSSIDRSISGLYDRLRYSYVLFPIDEGKARTLHPQRVYLDAISDVVNGETRWLDVGCGAGLVPEWMKGGDEIENNLTSRAKLLAGVDVDPNALSRNKAVPMPVLTNGDALPFADNSFDLVTCNMVLEHVKEPEILIKEIRRVLRSGGRFIALTPNRLDLITIGARLIPNRFHPRVISMIEDRDEADVYPTWYRFNSPAIIDRMLSRSGFTGRQVNLLEHPDVYSHVPVLSRLESVWHKIAQRQPSLRGTILIDAR